MKPFQLRNIDIFICEQRRCIKSAISHLVTIKLIFFTYVKHYKAFAYNRRLVDR